MNIGHVTPRELILRPHASFAERSRLPWTFLCHRTLAIACQRREGSGRRFLQRARAARRTSCAALETSALFALLDDPYTNLAATEAYIAANPGDLLLISQLCGYLIFYGGARKLERVLGIMESVYPSLHDDWAYLLIDLLEARSVELAARFA